MLARTLLVLVSVVATAWFAVSLVGERRLDAGKTIALDHAGGIGAADAQRATDDLRGARPLVAGTDPDFYIAGVELAAHRPAQAAGRIERIVAAEPDNLGAWTLLGISDRRRDPARAAQARARATALSPPVPAPTS